VQAKFIPVLVAVGLLVGCKNPDTDKKQAALEQQRSAIDAIKLVQADLNIKEVGDPEKLVFINDSGGVKEMRNIDYAAGRDAAIKAAIDKVSAAARASDPAPSVAQKALLNRSLANLYLGRANYQTQTALANWTDLTARSASLVSDVVQLEDAVTHAQSLSVDESKLISALRDNQAALDKELHDLQEKSASLEKEANELKETIAGLQAKNVEQLTVARKLRTDAMVLKGAGQYETYKKAIDAEGNAAQASFQAQRSSIKLDVVESEKKIVDTKLAVLTPASATLKSRMASVERSDAEMKKDRDDAIQQRDKIVARLNETFKNIAKDRDDKVVKRFEAAHTMAAEALKAIDDASKAPGDSAGSKKIVGLEKVSKHVTNAYLCTQELTTTAAYAKTLDTLAAQVTRAMPDLTLFTENAKLARDDAAKQVKTAKDAISAAQDLASRINENGGDPDDPYLVIDGVGETHNLLAEALAQLGDYDKRVEDIKNSLGLP
jgi:hypothetical protein